jgi:hypothetical protein
MGNSEMRARLEAYGRSLAQRPVSYFSEQDNEGRIREFLGYWPAGTSPPASNFTLEALKLKYTEEFHFETPPLSKFLIWRCRARPNPEEVTIVTHCSIDRLPQLDQQLRKWEGVLNCRDIVSFDPPQTFFLSISLFPVEP